MFSRVHPGVVGHGRVAVEPAKPRTVRRQVVTPSASTALLGERDVNEGPAPFAHGNPPVYKPTAAAAFSVNKLPSRM